VQVEQTETDKRRALLSHFGAAVGAVLSAGLLGWLVPLVVSLSRKNSVLARTHAVESLNFQLTAGAVIGGNWVIGACTSWMCLGTMYYLIGGGLTVLAAGLAVMGGLVAKRGEIPRYPVSFRLIR
jgi:uncharacterized protein